MATVNKITPFDFLSRRARKLRKANLRDNYGRGRTRVGVRRGLLSASSECDDILSEIYRYEDMLADARESRRIIIQDIAEKRQNLENGGYFAFENVLAEHDIEMLEELLTLADNEVIPELAKTISALKEEFRKESSRKEVLVSVKMNDKKKGRSVSRVNQSLSRRNYRAARQQKEAIRAIMW